MDKAERGGGWAGGLGGFPRVPSGHVLSETAGACVSLNRGRRLIPTRDAGDLGACIDGENRVSAVRLFRGPAGVYGSNHLSGGGLSPGSGDRRKSPRLAASGDPSAACAGGGIFPPTGESTVDRAEKKETVASLHEVFAKTSVVVVAQYSGLTVAQMQRLRRQMRQVGARVQVAKNRLAQIALKGTDVASIGPLLKGPTLIAHSNDPVAAAKAAVAFAKDHEKFVILGGAMGTTTLNPASVQALASLPSLDELRGKLVGLLVAPATKLAQLANAAPAKLARVVGAYAAKDAA
jgi:large subunit ribosomal protein L10